MTNLNYKKSVFILTLFAILCTSLVVGAPEGANVTDGTNYTLPTQTSDQINATNGTTANANFTSLFTSSRWSGFFGQVSGNFQLGDADNIFYSWAVANYTDAVVYVAENTTDFSGLVPATNSDMPAFLNGSANDNFTNTYNANKTFTSPSLSIGNVSYASTWQNGTQGNFESYALKDGAGTNIWAAKVIDDAVGWKNTSAVDYQVLVPVQEGFSRIFNFYLEMG